MLKAVKLAIGLRYLAGGDGTPMTMENELDDLSFSTTL